MIWGVVEHRGRVRVDEAWVQDLFRPGDGIPVAYRLQKVGDSVACVVAFGARGYVTEPPFESADRKRIILFSGRIANSEEGRAGEPDSGDRVSRLYDRFGPSFPERLKGRFVLAVLDGQRGQVLVARDRLGVEPLYYYMDSDRFVFASSIRLLFVHPCIPKSLHWKALRKVFVYNYNPGWETALRGVNRFPAGHTMVVEAGRVTPCRYWRLAFGRRGRLREEEIVEGLRGRLRQAVQQSVDTTGGPGVFLSGGMDSSTVLALAREASTAPIRTFSFRCAGESFDESGYARRMAKYAGTDHREIEYNADALLRMPAVVKRMNEPFCDVGINMATYLLGECAAGRVSYVLTGDGGDELFGGHPVYEADRLGRFVDGLPGILKRPLLGLGPHLPDSDKKKDFLVKLKRFSESLRFPGTLLSRRWRVYYDLEELGRLLLPELVEGLGNQDLFEDIHRFREEAGDWDPLSLSLYNDYHTVVDFYLRRNDLNRGFGLETRYPLLDHELVEYAATIPPSLKIKGWFDTKYVLKKAMDGILPPEILYRKDKLGHSVPFKNWLRQDKRLRDFVLDLLSSDRVRERGFFRYPFIEELIKEHLQGRRNNSHRIWTLAVFEMWLREHYDGRGDVKGIPGEDVP